MGLLEHKGRARIFYRYLSSVYDQVNPLFWNEEMRDSAVDLVAVQEEEKVLDIGCGTGFSTQALASRTSNVNALDQSIHQLREARKKEFDARYVLGDAEHLPYRDEEFDVVWSSGAIEYWPNPLDALKEAHRVTKPGGRILLVGPRRPSNRVLAWIADSIMLFYSEDEITEMLESAGWCRITNEVMGTDWFPDDAIVSLAHA